MGLAFGSTKMFTSNSFSNNYLHDNMLIVCMYTDQLPNIQGHIATEGTNRLEFGIPGHCVCYECLLNEVIRKNYQSQK